MSKKKNKVPKITEEQYNLYIAGLKNSDTMAATGALFDSKGHMLVPAPFNEKEDG